MLIINNNSNNFIEAVFKNIYLKILLKKCFNKGVIKN